MKFLVLFGVLAFSAVTMAGPVSETVKFEEYLYTGTFGDMAKSLESQLAAAIRKKCGAGKWVQVQNLSVSYQHGPFAGNGDLPANVVVRNGREVLNFPGHPFAEVSAKYSCE